MPDPTDTAPTAEQIAAVRAHLRQEAIANADEPRAAMVALVTSDAFGETWTAMTEAQRLNPGNVQLNYAIGMFDQLRTTFAVG